MFKKILPDSLGPAEFNSIILAELYGIDTPEKRGRLTELSLSKLRVDYEIFEDFVMSSKSFIRKQSEIRVKTDRGRPRRTKKQRRQDLLPPGPYAQKPAYQRQNQVDSTIKMKNRQDLQRAQQRNRQNEHYKQSSNVTVQQRRQQQQQQQQQ